MFLYLSKMDLYTLSKAYPVTSIVIALILFFIGLKIAKKIFWILAGLAIIAAVVLWFL